MAVIIIKIKKILAVGEDRRLAFAVEMLAGEGFDVRLCGGSNTDYMERLGGGDVAGEAGRCDALLLSMPIRSASAPIKMSGDYSPTVSRLLSLVGKGTVIFAGYISDDILMLAKNLGLRMFDYAAAPGFAERNAVPTAEGAAKLVIENTEGTVMHAKIAVLGYGRTGKAVAELLKSMDADVTIAARNDLARTVALTRGLKAVHTDELKEMMPNFDAVINTIPSLIITGKMLSRMQPRCPIIELASAPGGVDKDRAVKHGIRVINAPGLPAVVAPRAAGEIVAASVLEIIKEERI